MFFVDDGAASSLPTIPVSGTPGYFTNGAPGVAEATPIPAWWLNMVQMELRGLVDTAGLALDKTDNLQVLKATHRLYGGNYSYVLADAQLTIDNAGLVGVDASTGNITLTLPAASGMNSRPFSFRIARFDNSPNTVTVRCAGSNYIAGGASTITVPPLGTVSLITDGVRVWAVTGSFWPTSQSLAASGYVTMPGGLILQWGTATAPANPGVTNTAIAVTFPVTFPTAVRSIVANGTGGVSAIGYPPVCIANAVTTTGFTLGFDILGGSGTQTVTLAATGRWMAIGN